MSWRDDLYKEMMAKKGAADAEPKKHKYGAKKTSSPGFSFASKLEASVYDLLYLLYKAGEIRSIQCQDVVYLTLAKVIYKPDFKCTRPNGDCFWVEAKGFETPEWRIKRRLWTHYGPGELHVYMGSHSHPTLKEIIKPKS